MINGKLIERANKSVPDLIKINGNYVECWRNGYIRGAKEQREIDINKALAFIQSLDEELSIASFADFASFKSETFINRLRKYMEEN